MDSVSHLRVPSPTLVPLSAVAARALLPLQRTASLSGSSEIANQKRLCSQTSGSTLTEQETRPHVLEQSDGEGVGVLIPVPAAGRLEGPVSPSALGARTAGLAAKLPLFQHR